MRCCECALIYVPSIFHLDATAERAEYDLHENHIDDPGYRKFLSRLVVPLQESIPPAARGLDYGCGPGPALVQMLLENGHRMARYDPFYALDSRVLEENYDFITATEVVEHMYHPGDELLRLWEMLVPGGVLGVMTKLALDRAAFSNWHYKNDPTHVCFFSRETWYWWGNKHNARVSIRGADVILLRK